MDDPFDLNRKWWDEAVGIHVRSEGSEGYDVPGFKRGRSALLSVEREEVGDVRGKRLLHLQCHFGLDTLSWARLGAEVTGVDFSEKGIAQAKALAAELQIRARFLLSNVYDLPRSLNEEFDIVFSSIGVINWLPDLAAWAKIVARYVRPGGFFYLIDAHPFARIFYDERDATDLRVAYPYWRPHPFHVEEDGTYADKGAHFENRVTIEFSHTMGTIVDTIIDAGMSLDFLHEFPFCEWEMFPFMEKGGDGYYRLHDGPDRIPLLFSIRARKPMGEPTR
ncbi:MAG TPA: class I SAM-dependent methyltransferase [Thermoplasmata archaeon]|nr:class I SAM-dependent methyltransferase [Thermoplasmata archaeon]